MSRVPTDPDADDIKRILESMWEITSSDDDAVSGQDDHPKLIEISQVNLADRSRKDGFSNLDASMAEGDSQNGRSAPARGRLVEKLRGVGEGSHLDLTMPLPSHSRSGDLNGLDSSRDGVDFDAHQQLSSLSCKGDGQGMAAGKRAMQTSGEDQGVQGARVNGHRHNGNRVDLEVSHDEPKGQDCRSGETTTPAVSSLPETASNNPAAGVKREMTSFFDSRMAQMNTGAVEAESSGVSSPSVAAEKGTDDGVAPVQATVVNQPVAAVPTTDVVALAAPVSPAAGVADGGPVHESAAELMRPVLRQWLGENMPKIVEDALQIEAAQSVDAGDTKKPDK